MAIIAGQRALRKSIAADVIREWAPIAKENASGRAAASRCRFPHGTQRGHNPDKCELYHTRSPGSALLRCTVGATPARGRADVDAADGILVVQIRRVRAISREVFQLAAALITRRGAHMRQWRVGLPVHAGKSSFRARDFYWPTSFLQ